MRTYRCCQAVNDPGVIAQDYPALASMMQVSVDTMTHVYAAQSLQGPAAQLAFRLHASDEKEQPAFVRETAQDTAQQKMELEQQKQRKQKLAQEQTLRRQVQLQVQQERQTQQQQQVYAQQQQHLQQAQQQQYMQQQQLMQQQQQYMYPSPWMPPLFTAPAVPFPVSAPAAVSVPYGRALSTLRHKHDAAIQDYFASRGFCVDDPPGAARVATVFKELCVLRESSALPEEAMWFDFSATWFDDKHEKPFRDYIRKLFISKKGTTE
jgi:flagellar biosynthesis GTPase FlhF